MDDLQRRGLELVSSDLKARGWLIEEPDATGPRRLWASRPSGARRVVFVSCARYPQDPSTDRPPEVPAHEGEPWLARVQLTRELNPILAPQYLRLPPMPLRAMQAIPASWPPKPSALTF